MTQLKKSTIEGRPDVCISTIQRLFSILNGKEMSEEEENQLSDDLVDNDNIIPFEFSSNEAKLPRDYFDFIFVDECHRSIYGSWRKVLDYFDSARIVGLTATPGVDTYAFFNNTIAYRYSLEQSIVDGVNVGYRVFRIKTDATENGGTIDPKKAKRIRKRDNQTDKTPISSNSYTKTDLNQTVVNPTQIRTIIKSFKDSIYTKLYPDRIDNYNFIPKTLIFAQNERHAQNIVDAVNAVFDHQAGDGFVQQITYSSGNSNDLVKQFNNNAYFRIAVTVTLVATGTDVKPLEIVMFMRDIHSIQLYQQMRGRGCRSIDDDILRTVTPNATTKDIFYLIDAVGVTESEKEFAAVTGKCDATPTLEKLLEQITHGYLTDDLLMLLANKLARIHKKAEEPQREKFCQLAGVSLQTLSARIMDALSPVVTPNSISMCCALPAFVDINAPNTERKQLIAPLTRSKQARDYLLELNAGFLTILNPGEDMLISANFNVEEANAATTDFRKYLDENRDSFEALRIIYQRHVGVLTYEMLTELRDALIHYDARFTPRLLWEHYVTLDPQKAKKLTVARQRDLLTNLIQLIRYAWQQTDTLESLAATGAQYFNLWCGHNSGVFKRAFTDEQKALLYEISEYILANGYLTIREIREICDDSTASQIANIFGNAKEANQELKSLANFLIFHEAA